MCVIRERDKRRVRVEVDGDGEKQKTGSLENRLSVQFAVGEREGRRRRKGALLREDIGKSA